MISFKRLFISFLTFSFLFIVVSSFGFSSAQNKIPMPTPTPGQKVEYSLPYPGILPDHPLFFLKEIRDRVLGWFISDPLKKAEFNLLMADKELNTGLFLLEKGKPDLAQSAFTRAESYLDKSFKSIQAAKEAGKNTDTLTGRLSLAILKHNEVLTDVLNKVPEAGRKGIQEAITKSQRGLENIRDLQKKKLEKIIQERMISRVRTSRIGVEARER
ncbi:hypothetical protein HY439_03500 [Candidatus Microgenomates bacterium]|nr:hypothetical protein [Candidatus Microgenomates bacterium]